MNNKTNDELTLLNKAFDDLWPLFRSITGPGIEASLKYFSAYMPLIHEKVPSGTKIFDWTAPPEWHPTRGRLWGPDGVLICDTEINNLHLVNYSEPVSGKFTLEELSPHLHSLEHLPEAIPYVTSYYKKNWGFCIKDSVRKTLQQGTYTVEIDTKFVDNGGVPYAYTLLQGESEKEILISSYLCHPSLANNELSGPLALLALYNRIKMWPKRRYTYRFLLNPETIGSLCFLHNHYKHLQKNLESGIIIMCLGGPVDKLHYKQSKITGTNIDLAIQDSSDINNNWSIGSFTPFGGSDERQYCSPGFNLPVGRIARSYTKINEYHNSLDNKEFMDMEQLIKSITQIESMLKIAEISGKPVNQAPYGEPQLGKRGLYPNLNSPNTWKQSNDEMSNRWELQCILMILNMADGHTSMSEIAKRCGASIEEIAPTIEKLEKQNLIKFNVDPVK